MVLTLAGKVTNKLLAIIALLASLCTVFLSEIEMDKGLNEKYTEYIIAIFYFNTTLHSRLILRRFFFFFGNSGEEENSQFGK